jgi:hypothetical protein
MIVRYLLVQVRHRRVLPPHGRGWHPNHSRRNANVGAFGHSSYGSSVCRVLCSASAINFGRAG